MDQETNGKNIILQNDDGLFRNKIPFCYRLNSKDDSSFFVG